MSPCRDQLNQRQLGWDWGGVLTYLNVCPRKPFGLWVIEIQKSLACPLTYIEEFCTFAPSSLQCYTLGFSTPRTTLSPFPSNWAGQAGSTLDLQASFHPPCYHKDIFVYGKNRCLMINVKEFSTESPPLRHREGSRDKAVLCDGFVRFALRVVKALDFLQGEILTDHIVAPISCVSTLPKAQLHTCWPNGLLAF